jgi:2-octaprenyl-6-methoxyphenol hydroxylase
MTNAASTGPFDVAIAGAGPTALAAALCLARPGLRIALVGPAPPRSDNRTAGLFAGSIQLLRNLGVWDALAGGAELLTAIRIVDDMGGLLRAPEVTFTAAEVGLPALGYNIANATLAAALRARALAQADTITLIEPAVVERIEIGPDAVRLYYGAHNLAARLLVGADGRNSISRSAAGIAARTWDYDQSALTCTFTHSRDHGGVSTEFHRPAGPLTVVPSPGRASSLVWVDRPAIAKRLAALGDEAFTRALEARLQGLLGSIQSIGPRAVFPLAGLTAEVAARNRVALIGEAAHVLPPIGAQGLNLGLRDAASLADCVGDALAIGEDIGGTAVLDAYVRARTADVTSRTWVVDLLNRSLLSPFLPVQLARGLGLHAFKAIGPLRRLAIREGLAPSFSAPRLMRLSPDHPLDGGAAPLA